jgi:hypothetical protein
MLTFAEELEKKFEVEKVSAIKLIGTSVFGHPELVKFLGEGPLSDILKKGTVALRIGYYKLSGTPFYKEYGNGIGTFAANVLFCANLNDRCIEYPANIGPMVNAQLEYQTNDNQKHKDELFHKFISARSQDTRENNYLKSKYEFFTSLNEQGKIFRIISDEFSQSYPGAKQIKWTFIT